jgi:UDP-N-acetylmuramoyl-tripeptide--D-alanyl-D-alanine ligase
VTEKSPVLSIDEIVAATGGSVVQGGREIIFRGISTDSRTVGEGNIFIALRGDKFDGHNFLSEVVEKGAAGLLVSERPGVVFPQSPAVIRVEDTLRALGDIAASWRKKFSIPVVAITGSSGKTTTKEMLAGILNISRSVLKTEGNYNNLIGLPLTLLGMEGGHEIAIVELGTNSPGEIGRLTRIADPTVGIITNVGLAHLEGLRSPDMIREEKGDLFRCMNESATAVINADDEAVVKVGREWSGKRITYGINGQADVMAREIVQMGAEGLRFSMHSDASTCELTMNVLGIHHVYNALAAAATALAVGADISDITNGLSSFRPVSGRMNIKKMANGAYVIDDTYNANPSSVREALISLRDLKGKGKAFVILGDMLELGEHAEAMHESTGEFVAATGAEDIFLKGEYAPATAAGAIKNGARSEQIHFFTSDDAVTSYLRPRLKEGDWILVKGSRRMKMELVVQAVIGEFGLMRSEH